MTPIEKKAREIVKKYEDAIYAHIDTNGNGEDEIHAAKTCALLEIEARIEELHDVNKKAPMNDMGFNIWWKNKVKFLTSVKQAITDLK